MFLSEKMYLEKSYTAIELLEVTLLQFLSANLVMFLFTTVIYTRTAPEVVPSILSCWLTASEADVG